MGSGRSAARLKSQLVFSIHIARATSPPQPSRVPQHQRYSGRQSPPNTISTHSIRSDLQQLRAAHLPRTTPAASMVEQQQHVCKGLLVFQAAAAQSAGRLQQPRYESACYGVTSADPGSPVDLQAHHESSRVAAMEPPPPHTRLLLQSFTCLGTSTYQHGPSQQGADTPPPLCIGIEMLRYAHMTKALQQRGSAAAPAAHLPLHGSSSAPASGDVPAHLAAPLAHSAADASEAALPALESDVDAFASHHHHHHRGHQQSHELGSSSSSSGGPPDWFRRQREQQQQQEEQEQQPLPPGLLERLAAAHAEAAERLAGTDPLWFAKAFAARAQLNLASMRRTAGQLAAAARSDLGLQQEQEDDE